MRTLLSFSLVFILAGHLFVPSIEAQEQRGIKLNAPPSGNYYALVIGNNAYQKIRPLQTAETDAREVEALLKTQYGFQTKLLLNATRQQIVSALYSYRRVLNENANLLIYYAGHGVNDKEADKAYWLPVDAELDDNANWISADDITTNIKVIPAKHVLIVSDSCYSGTLTRGLGESLPRPSEREQFLRKMAQGRSRTLMASGGNEPVADGGGGKHSVFAAALLRGLREMDKGQFTAAELFRYHVEEPVAGRANQTPEYNPLRNSGHESGDFIFVRVKAGDKTVEVTVNAPPSVKVDPAQQELVFWGSIQSSTDAEDFKEYLAKYPTGLYAGIARRRVEALGRSIKTEPTSPDNSAATNDGSAAPPAAPNTSTPGGLILVVELLTPLDTSTTLRGDRFSARVVSPSLYEGSTVEGHVTDVIRGGRVTENGGLGVQFDTIRHADGRTYDFRATLLEIEKENVTGKDVRVKNRASATEATDKSRSAIGSSLGAVIGAIAGGGKGAAIGATIGDAGGGVVTSSGQDILLARGARLKVQTPKP